VREIKTGAMHLTISIADRSDVLLGHRSDNDIKKTMPQLPKSYLAQRQSRRFFLWSSEFKAFLRKKKLSSSLFEG
jgi:hypothetical protein